MRISNASDLAAIEAVRLSSRQLPASTYDALQATTSRMPDAPALSFFLHADSFDRPFTWTYAELLADITRAANLFRSLGVDGDNPVAFALPNLPETHFTIWGGEAAGIVLAINPMLDASQIGDLLVAAKARVLVTIAPEENPVFWAKLSSEFSRLSDLKTVACVSLATYRSGMKEPGGQRDHGLAFSGIELVDLRKEMAAQPSASLEPPRKILPDDASSFFCTGGTTGAPKIAVRCHRNEVFDAWSIAQVFQSDGEPRTFFCGLPLFHVNAQLITGLLPWLRGDHVILGTPDGYRGANVVARFWEIVAHYRIWMFSGVPTIYASLLEVPVGNRDISSLEFAICGAAPMPVALIRAFESKTGLKVLEGYGLTEATCVSSVNPPHGDRPAGSIGFSIPYQRMSVVILDEQGKFVRRAAVEEVGIVAIRGPNVFCGYLDARQNAGLWIDIEGELWLNTGDLGREDASGYFWLVGRKKELIIRGGHNIDPKSIEDVLHSHPAIALAAAVGSPDAYAGEVPVVYVVPRVGTTLAERELLEFAAANIRERAAVPKRVVVAASLPMTPVGKIFKPALQKLEIESAIRAEAERVGAIISTVTVDQDSQLGLLAEICISGNAAGLEEALERFSFKFRIRQLAPK